MAEIKDKVVTVESLSVLHEHNKAYYLPKIDPIVNGNLIIDNLSMNRLGSTSIGDSSATLGYGCVASGRCTVAEGYKTVASGSNQHVQGKNNIEDNLERYAHIVGNGFENSPSNAHTVDWNGNGWFAENVYVGGTSQDDATKLVKSTNVISIEYGDTLPPAGTVGRVFFKRLVE